MLPEFEKKSVKVFGVSGDSAASHTKFIEKLKLKFLMRYWNIILFLMEMQKVTTFSEFVDIFHVF